MSKVAYMILAHQNNNQLQKLISTLLIDKRSNIYLHLDIKAGVIDLDYSHDFLDGRITLVPRISVSWGGISVVEATQNLINAAMNDVSNSIFVLLSGSCFPLRNAEATNDDLLSQDNNRFSIWEILYDQGSGTRSNKSFYVDKFYPKNLRYINPSKNKARRKLFNLLNTINRSLPYKKKLNYSIAKGSQWFSVNREMANYILSQMDNVLPDFINTFAPDETFFQTIFWNSPNNNISACSLRSEGSTDQVTHYIANNSSQYRSLMNRIFYTIDYRSVSPLDVVSAMKTDALFVRKCSMNEIDLIIGINHTKK